MMNLTVLKRYNIKYRIKEQQKKIDIQLYQLKDTNRKSLKIQFFYIQFFKILMCFYLISSNFGFYQYFIRFNMESKTQNNTAINHNLYDALAGLISAFFVSPTNAILDKSVIEYANGKSTVEEGVKGGLKRLFTTPFQFFTSYKFKWMYFVYAMTYGTNNLTDHSQIIPGLSFPIQNLVMTFVVNTICGILKDKAYIQHFGAVTKKPFPVISLGLLFTRDLITVASAFTFPHIFGKQLEKNFGVSERKGLTIAQLLSPLLIQIFVTPLHLLGLDLYNRQGLKLTERMKYLKGLYPSALTMRMIRFLPAYGLGGVINNQLRRSFKNQ